MANKKAVLSKPLPNASLPRNAFDRESVREYHYALGQLCPVWWEPVIAGSHLKLNRKIFQRTSNLNTASFPIMDTHLQYYFVPYRQLWSLWDDFKLGIKDVNSSALIYNNTSGVNASIPNRVPYFDMNDAISVLQGYTSTPPAQTIYNQDSYYDGCKFLNLLGYSMPNNLAPTFTMEVNAWPILAYHKIYYDHFRNSTYETNENRLYNMDFLWSTAPNMKLGTTELNYGTISKFLGLHYVNYRNDYFNNLYPSLNYISSSALTGSNFAPGVNVGNPIGLPSNIVGLTVGGSDTARFGVNVSSDFVAVGQTGVSTYHNLTLPTLRSAFALDKLMRSSAYAPQHHKEQYEARFGIKFHNNPNESIFVGAFMNDIQIGEVTSTADTNNAGLGAIGGKGVSFADWGKTLEFNAKEDGIIMAVQYTTLRSNYRSLGIDSYLTKHLPEDYFQPEFQNLGLEPVYGSELNANLGQSTILGYRPRNQRYKLGVDKSYGLFADMQEDLSHFINHTDVNRLPAVGQSGVNFAWFKLKPSDLDGITTSDWDGTWSTDQFYGQTVFGATIIQNMSVHGQPSL